MLGVQQLLFSFFQFGFLSSVVIFSPLICLLGLIKVILIKYWIQNISDIVRFNEGKQKIHTFDSLIIKQGIPYMEINA